MAIFMKAKKVLVRISTFLKTLTNFIKPPFICFRLVYTKINKEVVGQVLIIQATTKAHGLDNIDFKILQII